MASVVNPKVRSYNTFSGVDIKAVFGNKAVGNLQAISYSVQREKAPIYTMGEPDARAFSRGKRGIAGTLVFIMFDRHSILSILGGYAEGGGLKFQSDVDSLRPEFKDPNTMDASVTSSSTVTAASTVDAAESNISTVGGDQILATAWYVDQIPPFDITLAAANELGALSVMRINGVEILNEGYGVSIDDMVSEMQHTYVATSIIGWAPVSSPNVEAIASQAGVSSGG